MEVLKALHSPDYDERLAHFFRTSSGTMTAEAREEAVKERSHYICFNVADFITSLWTREPRAYFQRLELTWKDLSKLAGVFRCDADTDSESHAFVIWNDRLILRYYSGYGGHEKAIYTHFISEQWFVMLQDAVHSEDKIRRWTAIKYAFALPALFDELHPRDRGARLVDQVIVSVIA